MGALGDGRTRQEQDGRSQWNPDGRSVGPLRGVAVSEPKSGTKGPVGVGSEET